MTDEDLLGIIRQAVADTLALYAGPGNTLAAMTVAGAVLGNAVASAVAAKLRHGRARETHRALATAAMRSALTEAVRWIANHSPDDAIVGRLRRVLDVWNAPG